MQLSTWSQYKQQHNTVKLLVAGHLSCPYKVNISDTELTCRSGFLAKLEGILVMPGRSFTKKMLKEL